MPCAVRASSAESEGGGITSLQGVSLRLAPPWPLTLVVQDAQLQQYNAILAVLLQVLPHFLVIPPHAGLPRVQQLECLRRIGITIVYVFTASIRCMS